MSKDAKPKFIESTKSESAKTFLNPKNKNGLTYRFMCTLVRSKKYETCLMDICLFDYKFPAKDKIYAKMAKVLHEPKKHGHLLHNKTLQLLARKLAKYGYGEVNVEMVVRI